MIYEPPQEECSRCRGTGEIDSGFCYSCTDGKTPDYSFFYEEMQVKLMDLRLKYPEEFI